MMITPEIYSYNSTRGSAKPSIPTNYGRHLSGRAWRSNQKRQLLTSASPYWPAANQTNKKIVLKNAPKPTEIVPSGTPTTSTILARYVSYIPPALRSIIPAISFRCVCLLPVASIYIRRDIPRWIQNVFSFFSQLPCSLQVKPR